MKFVTVRLQLCEKKRKEKNIMVKKTNETPIDLKLKNFLTMVLFLAFPYRTLKFLFKAHRLVS